MVSVYGSLIPSAKLAFSISALVFVTWQLLFYSSLVSWGKGLLNLVSDLHLGHMTHTETLSERSI